MEKNIRENAWKMVDRLWIKIGKVLTCEIEMLGERIYRACVVDGWKKMEEFWNFTDMRT